MSSKSTFSNSTSKSYALALYELSKENSELDKIEEEMKSIALDISDDVFLKLAMQAHERNVTLNTHIIDVIKDKLKNQFIKSEDILITRERHRQHLEQCVTHLEDFKNKNVGEEFDKAAEDLRLATRHLGIIVGKIDVEEILGSIFNDFCIGK